MDKGEFADRVHAIEDRMYRIAYGQLREAQDRKDAVQESILRAWTTFAPDKSKDSVLAYDLMLPLTGPEGAQYLSQRLRKASPSGQRLGCVEAFGLRDGAINPWVTENNTIWCLNFCDLQLYPYYSGRVLSTPTEAPDNWEESWAQKDVAVHEDYLLARIGELMVYADDELYGNEPFTTEESNRYTDTINTIKSYVKECIAAFTTGVCITLNEL